ncbi:MAG: CpsD/CapB family tyrosine-protein kinase, partial [Ruminococcus sp.]
GEIQQFSSGNSKKKSSNGNYKLISDKNTSFIMKESYKSMRTNIIFALSASNKKIITVSSANPSEGKSTTTSNISLSLAEAGKKVLLIDADLRKPVQHKIFQVNNKIGFSGVLGNINSFEEAVQKNVAENLDLLTSGIKPPNPSELIGSMNTYELLKGLSKIYDYIIIDTPPVNVVTDALNISSEISGMIMVLKHASTTTDDIEKAIKTVQLANGDLLGMIINDIQHKKDGSYYSKYNKNYYSSYEKNTVKEK